MKLIAVGILLLNSSFPIQEPSSLAEYERPVDVRYIDWLVLQTNLQILGDLDHPNRDTVARPLFYYDAQLGQIRSRIRVAEEFATGSTLATLRDDLFVTAGWGSTWARAFIPGLENEDIEMVFHYVAVSEDGSDVEFAFSRNGELSFE